MKYAINKNVFNTLILCTGVLKKEKLGFLGDIFAPTDPISEIFFCLKAVVIRKILSYVGAL